VRRKRVHYTVANLFRTPYSKNQLGLLLLGYGTGILTKHNFHVVQRRVDTPFT